MKKFFCYIIYRYKRLDIVKRASLVYIVVGFFQKGVSFISAPIFTRILCQNDYGIFCTYNSWYELIGVVAMLSLSAGVYNNGLMEYEKDRDRLTFSLLILSNIATEIVVLFIGLFWNRVYYLIALPKKLLLIMIISFIFSPAFTFWVTRKRYEYKYVVPCIVTIVSTFMAVGVSVLITWNSAASNKLVNKIWSEKGILLIFWIVIYIHIAYKAKFKIKIEYWRYALKYNLPLIPHYLSNYVLNSADRLMIANLIDTSSAAIYSVAYSVAFLVHIFWQSVNGAILPITYESIRNKHDNEIQGKVVPFLAIYGLLCVLVAFLAPEVMLIFAPRSYQSGVYIVPILVIGVFLTGLYCLFANVEFFYMSTKVIAFNSIFSALLNIFLNHIFIRMFGFMAAAYTTVVCYLIQTILHYVNYRRISTRIYNEKVLLFICIMVLDSCLVCLLLYKYRIIRYIVLIILLCIGVWKRKKFWKYISNYK